MDLIEIKREPAEDPQDEPATTFVVELKVYEALEISNVFRDLIERGASPHTMRQRLEYYDFFAGLTEKAR